MNKAISFSFEQSVHILQGPEVIPDAAAAAISELVTSGQPLVDGDRFSEFLVGLRDPHPVEEVAGHEAIFHKAIHMGMSSQAKAFLLSGTIKLARPARLHEHDQAVDHSYQTVVRPTLSAEEEAALTSLPWFQDCGKTYHVMLHGNSRGHSASNVVVTRNVLETVPDDVMDRDAKDLSILLVESDIIGKALRRGLKNPETIPDLAAAARAEAAEFRTRLPEKYQASAETFILAAYGMDSKAHTQSARFIDAESGAVRPAVTHEDRYNANGTEKGLTLDNLYMGHRILTDCSSGNLPM